MKTVRFSQLVKSAGRPVFHTLWSSPENDREFQQAVKKARVLTIHQGNVGQKADFGTVGFHADPLSQFLIFPRSLRKFEGLRVVGIKYDAVENATAPRAAQPAHRDKSAGRPAKNRKAVKAPESSRKTSAKASKERKHRDVRPLAPIEDFPAPSKTAAESASAERKSEMAAAAAAPAKSTALPKRNEHADTPGKTRKPSGLDRSAVRRELGRAMKELEAGKAVIAFRRLEKLSETLK